MSDSNKGLEECKRLGILRAKYAEQEEGEKGMTVPGWEYRMSGTIAPPHLLKE